MYRMSSVPRPIRLNSDKALHAAARGRNTAVIGCSVEAKDTYMSRVQELLETEGVDAACEWLESGRAYCEIASWVTGKPAPYKTIQAARGALLSRFSLTGLGTVNEVIAATIALLGGKQPSMNAGSYDLALGSTNAEVKSAYRDEHTNKRGAQIAIDQRQLKGNGTFIVSVTLGDKKADNGVAEMGWIIVPARVMRNFVKKHHGHQLEGRRAIVVPIESAPAIKRFKKYLHTSATSAAQAISSL
jgi:hypothetical protein